MNQFERALETFLGTDVLQCLQKVKVGIAGAGGLGSNCAVNLVRLGFKKFVIVDFDKIDASNLNRQFYFIGQLSSPKAEALAENLKAINPDIVIETHCIRITNDNVMNWFSDCDCVVEAFDNPECKKMIVEAFSDVGKLLVSASGIAGLDSSDYIQIQCITPTFYVIGDRVSGVNTSTMPPLAPRVTIAAAKQAEVVLRYFLKNYK